jgi:hypothetical protein
MRTSATLGIVVFLAACAAPSSRDSPAVWVEPVTGMSGSGARTGTVNIRTEGSSILAARRMASCE